MPQAMVGIRAPATFWAARTDSQHSHGRAMVVEMG